MQTIGVVQSYQSHFSTLDAVSEILKGQLYLTNFRGASDLQELKKLKIQHVVNVTSAYESFKDQGITYTCVSNIQDSPDDADKMEKILASLADVIDDKIKSNKAVLVHCAAGISRSSTVVIGYLVIKKQMLLKQAFDYVREQRKGIWPNRGFMQILIKIEKDFLKKNSCTLEEYLKWPIF